MTTPNTREGVEDSVYNLLEEHVHAEPNGDNIKHEFSPLRHEIHEDIVAFLHHQLQKAREEAALEALEDFRKNVDNQEYEWDGGKGYIQRRYHSELDQDIKSN